ncbi:MAG TPA: DUF3048 domain-containing protein [Anaerolineaceae bacterium]|nr:DUF3048 domain-containing protein [Anaerolineaceae bacterium]
MFKKFALLLLTLVVLVGCSVATPAPLPVEITPTGSFTAQASATLPAPTETATALPSPTAAPSSPPGGPAIDPLTGEPVSNPALLERRPLVVKVENLPRADRPQYGLSAADLVYEYYTEEGTTRFAAVFYGKDAERVGPIRSARFFDANVIRMYKGIFAFGSAYQRVLDRFHAAEFARQLVVETPRDCPPMCRLDPNGRNFLVTDTAQLSQYAARLGIDNKRQDLSGMDFSAGPGPGGQPAPEIYTHYSAAIYNRWDYDAAAGRYLRWVDQDNAGSPDQEKYGQLVDKKNNQPIGVENVVMLFVDHQYIVKTPTEVFDMNLMGSGTAYAARDGQIYKLKWQRSSPGQILRLTDESGKPYAYQPGQTWYEVLSLQSKVEQNQQGWRFSFIQPPK